jgi:predicted 3-demethylubiquinone-9 3-methyltransferase (glyoxalase superfamily)
MLMGSDVPPERFDQPKGFSVTVGVDTAAEAERIFNAFAQGGTVRVPITETFFAERFGMVTDLFGTPWMILDDSMRREQVAYGAEKYVCFWHKTDMQLIRRMSAIGGKADVTRTSRDVCL